ncbi:metallophosphoesterase [Peribacillus kribbensis]|uniref:metallophosphoesterase n=1 Tax=Peribacillus kribbensis TaxID=356658 RepID=UPI00041B0174|nr:metallophosphoesterase [Peribacillus kribbensis]
MKTTFLNLSDLHFSNKKMADTKIVLGALFQDLKKLDVTPDFILFNGDLINNGSMGFSGDNEYDLVMDYFIQPLLNQLNLDKNKIFFVPGNHDINRNNINDFLYGDLTEKFKNRDNVNDFVDKIAEYQPLLGRLEDFYTFLELFYDNKNCHQVKAHPLYSSFILEAGKFTVGIACLNSSWTAYGGAKDYGRLIVGERQVDLAANDIRDCDLKIAMIHHPLEWLREFDRESIYPRLLSSFDMVFTGHIHTQDTHQILQNNAKTLFYKCGTLFDGRFFNGYAITTYDFTTKEVVLNLREYYDKRRVFDKALNIVEDGQARFTLSDNVRIDIIKKNIETRNDIKAQVNEYLNRNLISVLSQQTNAPKNIADIYVPPLISNQSELTTGDEEEVFYNLDELLGKEDNLLFVGKKEMGKSTLINYICYKFMNSPDIQTKIPIIINFNELSKGKNIIKKAISEYLHEFGSESLELEDILQNGDFVLLIDNLDMSNSTKIEKINEFIKLYPNIRFVLTMNEDILDMMKLKGSVNFDLKYETYYLYSYRRSQTRQLIKKWVSNNDVNQDELVDRIVNILQTVGLPKTPFAISLLLSILEKQINYVPINEATLVDRFVEDLLDKVNVDEVKYETFDYVIKSDYLSYIAAAMVQKSQYYLEELDFEEYTINYFRDKGLETNLIEFKGLFFRRGILEKENGRVFFRLQCFFELFLAKYMAMEENREFREFVLSETNYLDFKNEIVYLTGLQRRNLNVIQLLEQRLLEAYEEVKGLSKIEDFTKLPIEELLTNKLRRDDLKEKLNKIKISEQEKDKMLDEKNGHSEKKADPPMVREKREERKERLDFFEILSLYSRVIKNCELLGFDEKVRALNTSIEKYCDSIGVIYTIIMEQIAEDLKEHTADEIFKRYEYVLTTGLPMIIQGEMLQTLGTPKLKNIIEKTIERTEKDFNKFMLLMLYADLRLENYISKLENFLKKIDSKVIREISLLKLLFYRFFYLKSDIENQKINNLVADLVVEKGVITKREKSRYIERLNEEAMSKKLKPSSDNVI